jgi:hypothetical protein
MVEEQEVFQITMRSKGARDPRTPGTHVFALFHRYQYCTRMAATLCNWIFVKPCEACGKCCDEFAKCMGDCCRPIYECCRPCCDYMEDFFDRPFAFTLSFVFCIVFAPAVALIALSGMAFGNTDSPVGCQYGNMPLWGVVFAVESFMDFAVAIYIFCKFNERESDMYPATPLVFV